MTLQGWQANGQHYRTIQALPLILGEGHKSNADYLDACRVKRNQAEYDRVGVVSAGEARELIEFVVEFRAVVVCWLQEQRIDFH